MNTNVVPPYGASTGKRNWGLFAAGIAVLLLGFLFLFFPDVSLVTMALWFGAGLIVAGLVNIYNYVRYRNSAGLTGWAIVAAVLDLLVGIIFIVHPIISATVIPWIAGWVLIFYGVFELVASWGLRSMGIPIAAAIVNGLVGILCGILFFFFPLSFVYVLAFFLIFRGGTLIAYGASKTPIDPGDGFPIF